MAHTSMNETAGMPTEAMKPAVAVKLGIFVMPLGSQTAASRILPSGAARLWIRGRFMACLWC